ncbi:MAG: amidophosphoribosyltransferase [Dehalococcoidia bacterium]|nr:amidophosphoribosyltransferase [Dehalococcoidia bacterium]
MRDKCAVFGTMAPGQDVARLTFFGLFALQHRGQESSGIVVTDGHDLYRHAESGLVSQVFDEDSLSRLNGFAAIGHNRYSTTGSSNVANAQPLIVTGPNGPLALAHNGNIVNARELREELEEKGFRFQTTTDSEVIANLIIASPGRDWLGRVASAMRRLVGAYSLTLLTTDTLLAVRDPNGIRPLSIGHIGANPVVASESCALDHLGARFEREIEPGEVVSFRAGEERSIYLRDGQRRAFCVFEHIYLARPDSILEGQLVYAARQRMGAQLWREYPVDADLVVGVPDSAIPAAIGYADASGIPYCEGLLKNRYIGRTFIAPDQHLRDLGVQLKFNPLSSAIEGKRLVLLDDSIVRGTTIPHVVTLLRRAGAREVHLRICAPPILHPCYLGVDMATERELIATRRSLAEIREYVGADSLGYISMDGLVSAVQRKCNTLCTACFTGEYPVPIQMGMGKFALETAL